MIMYNNEVFLEIYGVFFNNDEPINKVIIRGYLCTSGTYFVNFSI